MVKTRSLMAAMQRELQAIHAEYGVASSALQQLHELAGGAQQPFGAYGFSTPMAGGGTYRG